MKIDEYTAYYGLYYQGSIRINGTDYSLANGELWENGDLEIDEWIIDRLNIHDQWGFSHFVKTIETERELINFLQEHLELYISRSDYETIEWLEYTMSWFLPHTTWFKGWQVVIIEKWLYDKIKVYSEFYITRGVKESSFLPTMFNDPEKLESIYSQLEKHSFVKNEKWIGKRNPKTGKLPGNKQLAALTLIFDEKGYFKNDYSDKQKHIAVCNYFNVSYSNFYFKYGQRIVVEDYKALFTFI